MLSALPIVEFLELKLEYEDPREVAVVPKLFLP